MPEKVFSPKRIETAKTAVTKKVAGALTAAAAAIAPKAKPKKKSDRWNTDDQRKREINARSRRGRGDSWIPDRPDWFNRG